MGGGKLGCGKYKKVNGCKEMLVIWIWWVDALKIWGWLSIGIIFAFYYNNLIENHSGKLPGNCPEDI